MPAVGQDSHLAVSEEQHTLIGVFSLSPGAAFCFFGRLGDRIGRKRVVLVGFAFSILLTLLFSFFSDKKGDCEIGGKREGSWQEKER